MYLSVPAAVCLTLGHLHGEAFIVDDDTMKWFWPNYLFFAAPQLVWAVIHRVRLDYLLALCGNRHLDDVVQL